MGDGTKISWSEATWNPVVGCSVASPGCDNCYAAREAAGRLRGVPAYAGLAMREPGRPAEFTGEVRCLPERLDQPLRWRRPRRIFVNSMSDLFHPKVPDEFIAKVFQVMAQAQHHTFQVLTKRPQRMAAWVGNVMRHESGYVTHNGEMYGAEYGRGHWEPGRGIVITSGAWPLPNVWLGTSVENQRYADLRIPHLLRTHAAVRWLSCEPLLGSIDLDAWLPKVNACQADLHVDAVRAVVHAAARRMGPTVDWIVVGGESGPGARPMHPDWARSLRDQSVAAGVPYHFKQHGEWVAPGLGSGVFYEELPSAARATYQLVPHPPNGPVAMLRVGKKTAGRVLDGRVWDEYPGGPA
jgi:protein gp37